MLSSEAIEILFQLTELHPYYMNVLCDKAWIYCDTQPPSKKIFVELWQEYIQQETSKLAKELSQLNTSQKKILIEAAKGARKDFTSKVKLQALDLSSSSVIKALKFLEEQDYLNRDKNGEYFVVDPLIKASLQTFYP